MKALVALTLLWLLIRPGENWYVTIDTAPTAVECLKKLAVYQQNAPWVEGVTCVREGWDHV